MTEKETTTQHPAQRAGTEGGARFQEGASAYLPDGTPIDNVGIVRATIKHPMTGDQMEVTAAATKGDVQTGAGGQALPATEMGGGNIAATLAPKPQPLAATVTQQRLERAAASSVVKQIGHLVQRPLLDWGLVGQGDVVAGHMILVDLDSGEKVRVLPGTRIEEDRLFANTRNFPEFLTNGDALERLST